MDSREAGGAAGTEPGRPGEWLAESALLSDQVAVKLGPGGEAGAQDKSCPFRNMPRLVLKVDMVAKACDGG